jgi:hypothetical protein
MKRPNRRALRQVRRGVLVCPPLSMQLAKEAAGSVVIPAGACLEKGERERRRCTLPAGHVDLPVLACFVRDVAGGHVTITLVQGA